ncbi:hypothetical protein F4561_001411 [Lipingzhangella halophila]|uniref:Uncharacterized protein n=1 Tax=Lipingzhangella halophila TaxID=1783352 RepID=A0A7W7REQ9_9ACTN|nr:hypothetical protein [Lipingzhangella halophila]MBB4930591.1 hypothetical protein [Lipingzhangella halophila]
MVQVPLRHKPQRSIGTSTASVVAAAVLTQMTVPLGETMVPTQDGFRTMMAIGAAAAAAADDGGLPAAAQSPRQ